MSTEHTKGLVEASVVHSSRSTPHHSGHQTREEPSVVSKERSLGTRSSKTTKRYAERAQYVDIKSKLHFSASAARP